MALYLYSHLRLRGVDSDSTFFFALSVIFYKANLLSGNAVDVHSVSRLPVSNLGDVAE